MNFYIFLYFVGIVYADISCNTLVGYYEGTFQDLNGNNPIRAVFEVTLFANTTSTMINGWFSGVNYQATDPNLWLHFYSGVQGNSK